MSLFKISRGSSTNLANVEKHDGYAWYTQDDAGFYIDAKNTETNEIERKRINDAENTTLNSDKIRQTNVKAAIEYLSSVAYTAAYMEGNEEIKLGVPTLDYEEESETLGLFKA